MEAATMATLLPLKREPSSVDMLRDQSVVIDRRGGDPVALKKAFAKLRRTLKKMPPFEGDVLAELRETRERRGRV